MLSLSLCRLLVALCGALTAHGTSVPFINSDYTAQLVSYEGSGVGQMSLNLRRDVADPSKTIVSAELVVPDQYPAGYNSLITVVSDLVVAQGTVFATNDTASPQQAPQCGYSFNVSLARAFDLSSQGWLANPLVTAETHASGSTLFTVWCGNDWRGFPVNKGVCIEADLSRRYVSEPSTYRNTTMSLLVAANGVPEQLFLNGNNYKASYGFVSFTPVSTAPIIPIAQECYTGVRCTNNTSTLKVQLYRQHGNSTLFKQINNTNLASLAGETYWLCDYNVSSPLISLFSLTVDGRWSTYSLCNGGQCSVTDLASIKGVGRQLNDGSRTCSYQDATEPDDSNVTCNPYCRGAGAWYSFPSAGACPIGSPLGTNGCVWLQTYKTVKTIEVSCLRRVSFDYFSCRNDTIGFFSAELARAFKLCPDVQGDVGDEISAEEFYRTDQKGPLFSSFRTQADDIASRETDADTDDSWLGSAASFVHGLLFSR